MVGAHALEAAPMTQDPRLATRTATGAAAFGPSAGLVRVACYARLVPASLERVLENVLDWEHLPWLHHESFCGIDLVASDRDGFEAWIAIPPRETPRRLRIEVRLDRPRLRYVTRTVEGAGVGSEIWTQLAPRAPRETSIGVGFWLPAPLAAAGEIGRSYVALYTRLWEEDVAMMRERQRVLDAHERREEAPDETRAVSLGPASALRAAPRVVEAFGTRWRVAWQDGGWRVHTAVCPHLGGPLGDVAIDADGCVTCPWHGYRFDVATGRSADGRAYRLPAPPRIVVDRATDTAALRRREGE